MTAAQFMLWEPGDGHAWQLVDGVPQAMAPATRTHGAVQSELVLLIGEHLRRHRPGCSIVTTPGVVPRAAARLNVRIPDLAVTCSPYVEEQATLPDPILVIEILSPGNQAETWANVWAYCTIPSVTEILVVRTDRIGAHLIRRLPDASWPDDPTDITEGDLRLDSIGFGVGLRDLYRTSRLA